MDDLISKLKKNWPEPRTLSISDDGNELTFTQMCTFGPGNMSKMDSVPKELDMFYRISDGATLYEDIEFGQWGLRIVPYDKLSDFNTYCRSWREDLTEYDLIIGEFLGDSDLLLISLAPDNNGHVVVCLPLDARNDWYKVGVNFMDFLENYIDGGGIKFWEGRGGIAFKNSE